MSIEWGTSSTHGSLPENAVFLAAEAGVSTCDRLCEHGVTPGVLLVFRGFMEDGGDIVCPVAMSHNLFFLLTETMADLYERLPELPEVESPNAD